MKEKLALEMMNYFANDPARIQHFIKVANFSQIIGVNEKLNPKEQEILEVASIVHDIGIKKAEELYGQCNGRLQEELGPNEAEKMLEKVGYSKEIIERVSFLVGHHHTYSNIEGMDYQILVEADFLVNFYEEKLDKKVIQHTCEKLFKTKTGIKICHDMFL